MAYQGYNVVFFGAPEWSVDPDLFDGFIDDNGEVFDALDINNGKGEFKWTAPYREFWNFLENKPKELKVVVRYHDFYGRDDLVDRFLEFPNTHLLGEFLKEGR